MGAEAAQPIRGQPDDGVIRRSFGITTRGIDLEQRTVTVVASTTTEDSHGDIIEQDWDLARYLKNPVVLWNHNVFGAWRYSDGTSEPKDFLPIGHSVSCSVEGGQLVATLKFGSAEYNEMSERVLLGFAEGHLRAVSVGFYPGVITEEKVEGGYRYRLSQCELLEISAVPIPSNPDAVAKSLASDHDRLGRIVAERRARAQETTTMAMSEAEQKSLNDAQGEVARLKLENGGLVQRAEKAETELATTKTALEAANKLAGEATEARTKTLLDGFQGKKFAPAEREDIDAIAKQMGIDFVVKQLEKRADLAVTAPNLANGLTTKTNDQPAPAPLDGQQAADNIVSDLVKSARATN